MGSGRGGVDLGRWSAACAQDDGLLRRLRCGERRRGSRSWVARGLVDGTASVYFGWNMTRAHVVSDGNLQHNILLPSLLPRSIVRAHGRLGQRTTGVAHEWNRSTGYWNSIRLL